MTAPEMLTMNCPSDETLALFVEGKLDGDARAAVIEHLTECADCRDIVLMASEEATATTNNVVPIRRPKWLPYLAAAAAVLVLMFGAPAVWRWMQPVPFATVRNAETHFEKRQTHARLSYYEAYKPAERTVRGNESEVQLQAEIALNDAIEHASQRPTADNLHELGLAYLLTKDRKAAVTELERARRLRESAPLLNDLAAAYIERGDRGDYEEALRVADSSLKIQRTPAALWNRALAIEYLGKYAQAIGAWKEYIAAEPDPAWDAEAQGHINDLTPPPVVLPSRP